VTQALAAGTIFQIVVGLPGPDMATGIVLENIAPGRHRCLVMNIMDGSIYEEVTAAFLYDEIPYLGQFKQEDADKLTAAAKKIKPMKKNPITSAATFMVDNQTDPVKALGTRENGNHFFWTVSGRLYEFDQKEIAILESKEYKLIVTPKLSGAPTLETLLSDQKKLQERLISEREQIEFAQTRVALTMNVLRHIGRRILELEKPK